MMSVYRKLLPTDLPLYREHLLRLSPEDRYARFAAVTPDSVIRAHCEGLDWCRTVIVGFIQSGVLRGAAELRLDPGPWPGQAELAVSVEPAFQNQGIGGALLRRALTVARNRAVRRVTLICQNANRRMLRLVQRFRGLVDVEGSEAQGTIVLPWPNQVTLLQEMIDDSTVALTTVLDQWQRWGRPAPRALAA